MLARIRAWFSPPTPERFGPYTAGEWYEKLQSHFDSLDRDTVTALLSAAVPQPWTLPMLISSDGSEGIRVLAMIQAALDSNLECETALIAGLNAESEHMRRTAAGALLRLNTIRGLAAIAAGNRFGHSIRTHAAHQLRQHGPAAVEAIPALLILIEDPDAGWRSHLAAAHALAAIGKGAFPYLVHALYRGSPQLQHHAAIALRESGEGGAHTERVDQLLKGLDNLEDCDVE